MTFTLLIGNNFISNSPKNIKYDNKILFKLDQNQNSNIPSISVNVFDQKNNQVVKVENNILKECSSDLTKKKSEPEAEDFRIPYQGIKI